MISFPPDRIFITNMRIWLCYEITFVKLLSLFLCLDVWLWPPIPPLVPLTPCWIIQGPQLPLGQTVTNQASCMQLLSCNATRPAPLSVSTLASMFWPSKARHTVLNPDSHYSQDATNHSASPDSSLNPSPTWQKNPNYQMIFQLQNLLALEPCQKWFELTINVFSWVPVLVSVCVKTSPVKKSTRINPHSPYSQNAINHSASPELSPQTLHQPSNKSLQPTRPTPTTSLPWSLSEWVWFDRWCVFLISCFTLCFKNLTIISYPVWFIHKLFGLLHVTLRSEMDHSEGL